MAGEVLMGISKDEAERARLASEFKYQMDTQSKMGYARREGRKEGREEGRVEGRVEGLRETARKLKAFGVPIAQIAQGTGLTEAEVEKL
ncbi:hypothetical protein FACS189450_11690 [Spirochaetia bacterium]|nr:hypothetical protein FACS189450_11690 [Spirochaetia bacterium]